MTFRIADTFTDSLARLSGDEQKAVKTTVFDLQVNPANPGLSFHKLDKAKDKQFWSVRVNAGIRLIVHRTDSSLLLCYVDHHDAAYRWAERRKLETHPKTGAAQLVEIRETVREIEVPKYVEVERPAPEKPPVLAHIATDQLLGYGVPEEWVEEVQTASEERLLALMERLPGEAAEAILSLATGVTPEIPKPAPSGADPFAHPDAQRRFRLMENVEELERALAYPWEKWTIFLHPAQRQLVERDYNGPARVSGTAGTGKTIVALHRAVHVARSNPDARVLLATFSETLAHNLRTRLRRLIGDSPRLGERIEVHAMEAIGRRLYEAMNGPIKLAGRDKIRPILEAAAVDLESHKFRPQFLLTEWEHVVDAWQLDSWEAYRDVVRLGRKIRLPESQRKVLWGMFEKVRESLTADGLITESMMFTCLAERLGQSGNAPFDFAVVDEAQDIAVAQLRFLAALGGDRPGSLFFAGDLGQRIFQQPYSWKSLGVDIRGRSHTLRVNYRTSHQIREQADKLLDPEVSDVDGNIETRRGTQSVFNGPVPTIVDFNDVESEVEAVSEWLSARIAEEVQPHEIAVFVRSNQEIGRARKAVHAAGLTDNVLDERVETKSGQVSISTMHLAKGLEFRAVAVMACDDEVIPLQERIETVADEADLLEVYATERHLLYVACTRARDHLLVTSGDSPSEFLDDLRG